MIGISVIGGVVCDWYLVIDISVLSICNWYFCDWYFCACVIGISVIGGVVSDWYVCGWYFFD